MLPQSRTLSRLREVASPRNDYGNLAVSVNATDRSPAPATAQIHKTLTTVITAVMTTVDKRRTRRHCSGNTPGYTYSTSARSTSATDWKRAFTHMHCRSSHIEYRRTRRCRYGAQRAHMRGGHAEFSPARDTERRLALPARRMCVAVAWCNFDRVQIDLRSMVRSVDQRCYHASVGSC